MTADYFLNSLSLDPFRRVFYDLDVARAKAHTGYPPYNIVQNSDTEYTIEIAVAGFSKNDLDISLEEGNVLHVVASKAEETEEKNYLIRGLAARGFVKKFTLADSIVVDKTKLVDGILSISLKRILPQSKTRKLEIS